MYLIFFCVFMYLNVCVRGYVEAVVTVDTPVGQINGRSIEAEGFSYTAFIGIPYGLVDEKNPFGNARPHPPFKTPHLALNDSTICPQLDKGFIKGNIQCLQLNVYRPNVTNPAHTLPVMVFIHGGAFVEGSASPATYSPTFLTSHNVILVTVNYRLGPYGFLCFPNTEYINQGLKDQSLALKWVKNNIRSFGGDDENILLFGHSAGSISVEYHLLDTEDRVFNKVILQSGAVTSSIINLVTDMTTFAKDVGLDDKDVNVDNFIKTISTIDANTIINITKSYNFRPCFDGELPNKTAKLNNLQNTKVMIGSTMKEILFLYPTAEQQKQIDFVAELNNGFSVSKMADVAGVIESIKNFYLENSTVNIIDYGSDLAFNYPIERSIRYYIQNNCTVYRYLFSYDGRRNYVKVRDNVKAEWSTHGDELGYLFYMPELEYKFGNITEEDQVVIDGMTMLWTNFAKFGDPTPTPSKLLPAKWTPETARAKSYLQIDKHLSLHSGRPFEQRMSFWNAFYAKHGMYVKGIRLGEFTVNRAAASSLTAFVLVISVLLLKQ